MSIEFGGKKTTDASDGVVPQAGKSNLMADRACVVGDGITADVLSSNLRGMELPKVATGMGPYLGDSRVSLEGNRPLDPGLLNRYDWEFRDSGTSNYHPDIIGECAGLGAAAISDRLHLESSGAAGESDAFERMRRNSIVAESPFPYLDSSVLEASTAAKPTSVDELK